MYFEMLLHTLAHTVLILSVIIEKYLFSLVYAVRAFVRSTFPHNGVAASPLRTGARRRPLPANPPPIAPTSCAFFPQPCPVALQPGVRTCREWRPEAAWVGRA
jgi:hypothetical protein